MLIRNSGQIFSRRQVPNNERQIGHKYQDTISIVTETKAAPDAILDCKISSCSSIKNFSYRVTTGFKLVELLFECLASHAMFRSK